MIARRSPAQRASSETGDHPAGLVGPQPRGPAHGATGPHADTEQETPHTRPKRSPSWARPRFGPGLSRDAAHVQQEVTRRRGIITSRSRSARPLPALTLRGLRAGEKTRWEARLIAPTIIVQTMGHAGSQVDHRGHPIGEGCRRWHSIWTRSI